MPHPFLFSVHDLSLADYFEPKPYNLNLVTNVGDSLF